MADSNETETALCTWKVVVIRDIEKLKAGNPIRTFNLSDSNLSCVSCSGYETACEKYHSRKEKVNE